MIDEGVVADLDHLRVLEENSRGNFDSLSPPFQSCLAHVITAGDKGEQVEPSFYDFGYGSNHSTLSAACSAEKITEPFFRRQFQSKIFRVMTPDAHGSDTLPFVIPSVAEGSAVLQACHGNVLRQDTDAG